MSNLISDLNQAQSQATSAPNKNCLVLAGAGSGKTRVLVRRIAWLIQLEGIRPTSIMAVTFTNKASKEMLERLERLCPEAKGLWMGTFHGICHKLLRLHSDAIGVSQDFQVLDSDDQTQLIRQIIKDNNLQGLFPKDADNPITPKKIVNWIGSNKDHGVLPDGVVPLHDDEVNMLQVFRLYQERCRISHLLDFADLLLKAHELLARSPALLSFYQNRFTNILVDEFQDTNKVQYDFIKLLAGNTGKVFAVGDDDQSIYGWRGAMIANINSFLVDFNDVQFFKLEQNYRSTSNILKSANHLISNNPGRLGKNLWTENKDESKVLVYETEDEVKEAQYVAREIYRLIVNKKVNPSSCAILYRSNVQSRALEEQFLNNALPYQIYGGLRFFDRSEVKDFMAYLRLVNSYSDDTAFERVVNVPARGLGDKSVQKIRDHANSLGIPLFIAANQLVEGGKIAGKAGRELEAFLKMIQLLGASSKDLDLAKLTTSVLEMSGLRAFYKSKGDDPEDVDAKIKNMEELVSVAERFVESRSADPQWADVKKMSMLTAFLSHAALEAGEEGARSGKRGVKQDSIQMMTLHASKGLEFPYVFIVGMNSGLFPSSRAMETEAGFHEERRLAYVGITRAMQELHLVYALRRRLYGNWIDSTPSFFINELPKESIQLTTLPKPKMFNSNQEGW